MPYCQNCGAEAAGNFCPNCGAQTGTAAPAAPQLIIHENVDIKPRYSVGAMVLAGYLGFVFLITAVIMLICGVVFLFNFEFSFGEKLIFPIAAAALFGVAYLLYLPGIKSIRNNSPEELVGETLWSFFRKSLVFIFVWGVTMAGCVYIIGLFFKVWRLGLWASCPNADQYTAFVNGEKIPVTRYIDDIPYGGGRSKYIYQDANGEFYRPAVR